MEMPEYIVQMQDGTYTANVNNSCIMRFEPRNIIDHLELVVEGLGTIAAYNCLELLDELEDMGWPVVNNGTPNDKELAIAEEYFSAELDWNHQHGLF